MATLFQNMCNLKYLTLPARCFRIPFFPHTFLLFCSCYSFDRWQLLVLLLRNRLFLNCVLLAEYEESLSPLRSKFDINNIKFGITLEPSSVRDIATITLWFFVIKTIDYYGTRCRPA